MERNSIVICLCALISFCAACTTDSELSTDFKTYKAPIVLEGVIQRTDQSTNSVTVRVKKYFKSDETFEVIDISGFGTDEPCIVNADELQIDETYILFIRKLEEDGSYFVESNPVPSTRDETRTVRKIACNGCAQAPSIAKQLRNKTVKEGSKFTLKCQVKGLPAPTVRWTKDGETISKGIKTSKKSSRLKVKKARKDRDEGVYMCIADNGIGQASSSAVINVCDLTCENNGDLNLKKCSCLCKDGWEGERCDRPLELCHRSCEHGTLDETKCECQCEEGYSGDFCNYTVCTKICGAHGELDVLNCNCLCDEQWSGDYCESSETHLLPCVEDNYCLNKGKCYMALAIGERICHCPAPYTGNRCQLKDPNTVYQMMQSAKDLHTKRILTVVGVFVALLVLIIVCIVAWCKARSDRNHNPRGGCCLSSTHSHSVHSDSAIAYLDRDNNGHCTSV